MSDELKCDREVFEKGQGICIFHASTAVTEPWVQKVAAESGQRVDWHYSGGWVNMLYLGDYERVRAAVEKLKPELEAAAKECHRGWGLSGFQILPPASHGLYRAGDPLPEGAIAVSRDEVIIGGTR